MSLRTHCMVEPGKGRQLLYKLIQYLRQEGRRLSIFSCCSWAPQWLCAEVFPQGKWSLQLSQQWAYRPSCWAQGFLQVETKTYKEVMSWGPGRQHSKNQFSVVSNSVQGDLCKVKFCTSQKARKPTRPARNKPVPWKYMGDIALCSHDSGQNTESSRNNFPEASTRNSGCWGHSDIQALSPSNNSGVHL